MFHFTIERPLETIFERAVISSVGQEPEWQSHERQEIRVSHLYPARFARESYAAIFVTNRDFFVAFVQMQSLLQTEFLLSLTLLCFPVSNLLSSILLFHVLIS